MNKAAELRQFAEQAVTSAGEILRRHVRVFRGYRGLFRVLLGEARRAQETAVHAARFRAPVALISQRQTLSTSPGPLPPAGAAPERIFRKGLTR